MSSRPRHGRHAGCNAHRASSRSTRRTAFSCLSRLLSRNVRAAALALALLGGALPAAAAPGDACEIETRFTRRQCDSEGLAGTPFVRGVNCRVVPIDGFPREYIVYVPENPSFDPDEALPVVFMFHGSSGDATKFLRISGWREKAEEVGLIAVFPTGLEHFVLDSGRCSTKWHDYSLPGEIDPDVKPRRRTPGGGILDYPAGAPWPPDDVGFVEAMLEDVEAEAHVDRARVYATGFSNGANFTARLAVELADRFAAAAWVGGGLDAVHVPDARRMPVAIVAGQCDEKLAENLGLPIDKAACVAGQPNAGGLPLDPAAWPGLPVLETFVSHHLESFGLELEPDDVRAEATFGQVTWRTPVPANFDGNRLKLTVLAGITHEYPRCDVGGCNNSHGFSAADRFWQLFSAYAPPACALPPRRGRRRREPLRPAAARFRPATSTPLGEHADQVRDPHPRRAQVRARREPVAERRADEHRRRHGDDHRRVHVARRLQRAERDEVEAVEGEDARRVHQVLGGQRGDLGIVDEQRDDQ